jgi:PPOX class probable F420-dependent enzyme
MKQQSGFSQPLRPPRQPSPAPGKIIWLITVDADNRPQPRPVWFHWDGETVLIFSESNKAKLRHIARNPKVSLNFNTDEDGGDVAVLDSDENIGNYGLLKVYNYAASCGEFDNNL